MPNCDVSVSCLMVGVYGAGRFHSGPCSASSGAMDEKKGWLRMAFTCRVRASETTNAQVVSWGGAWRHVE